MTTMQVKVHKSLAKIQEAHPTLSPSRTGLKMDANGDPSSLPASFSRYPLSYLLQNNISVPPDFFCPLSLDIMREPVLIASGQTFERSEIEKWFREGNRMCPVTKQALENLHTLPNKSLRSVIAAWCAGNGVRLSADGGSGGGSSSIGGGGGSGGVSPACDVDAAASSLRSLGESPQYSQTGSTGRSMSRSSRSFADRSNTVDGIAALPGDSTALGGASPACPIWPVASPSQSPSANAAGGGGSIRATKSHDLRRGWTEWSAPQPNRSEWSGPQAQEDREQLQWSGPQVATRLGAHSQSRKPLTSWKEGDGSSSSAASPYVVPGDGTFCPTPRNSYLSFSGRLSSSKTSPRQGPGSVFHSGPFSASFRTVPNSPAYSTASGGFGDSRRAGGEAGRESGQATANSGSSGSSSGSGTAVPPLTPEEEALAGVIPSAVAGLASSDAKEVHKAVEQLRGAVKDSKALRLRAVEAGCIAPLVRLLLSAIDPTVVLHAVTAVLNLALTAATHKKLVEHGVVPAVVAVLVGAPARKLSSTSLSLSSAVVAAGQEGGEGIPREVPTQAKENAGAAVFVLTSSSNTLKLVVASVPGVVPGLIAVLGKEYSLRGRKDAALALFNVSVVDSSRPEIVAAGAVPVLVEMLSEYGSGLEDKAAAVIANITKCAEGCRAVRDADGIPPLVEMLETGSARGKEDACASLLKLADVEEYRDDILAEGVMPTLVALVQSGTARTKAKASNLLTILRQKS